MDVTRFEQKSKRGRTRRQEVTKLKKGGGRWRQSTCHVRTDTLCKQRKGWKEKQPAASLDRYTV